MNYILNILYFIFILIIYYYFGSKISKFLNKKSNFGFKIVFGYIFVYFIGFVIGFPSQLFSISWLMFSIIYGITLLGITALFIHKDQDLKKLKKLKIFVTKQVIKNHLKNYWFVYALTFTFSILSILNTQPYYYNNYHDDYYIAKVVHLVGSSHLLNKDYSLGNIIPYTGVFDYALKQGYRMFNTYELIYSFWGTLFHIDLTFFCRFSMVINNYFITFLIYQLVSQIFIKKEYSQFSLIFFSLLLLPSGYASRGPIPIHIRMYENWRFQTAIFYGGSVTRVMMLPILFYFFNDFLEKVDLRKITILIMFLITMISFQTNALLYAAICIPLMLVIYIYYKILRNIRDKRQRIYIIILFCCVVGLLIILPDRLISILSKNNASDQRMNASYQLYYINVFKYDFIAIYSLVPCLGMLFLAKGLKEKASIILILLLFLMFKLNKSSVFMNSISYFFYGTVRWLTSILIICLLMFGVFLVTLFIKINMNKKVISILCAAVLISMCGYIKMNERKISSYNQTEDGITKLGYSKKILTDNDKMLPEMFVEVGKYFDENGTGNDRILTEKQMPYDGVTVTPQSLLLASNKIQICYDDLAYKNSDYDRINDYLSGKIPIDKIAILIQYSKSNYILTTRNKIQKDLVVHGYKIVLSNQKYHYWLLKGSF